MSPERLEKLNRLRDYIVSKISNQQEVNLLFICVQNSRRSHLAQVLAQDAASRFQINNIYCYSGGVEVTRVHSNTIKTLQSLGYLIQQKTDGENPIYECVFNKNKSSVLLYSKNFEEITSKLSQFAAVMVCSETETNCPYVPGAEMKILLPYDDPKAADNSTNPLLEYIRVAKQIQEEMEIIFQNVRKAVTV
ncbi:MAG: arsenate reductase [Bacteroidia bacterium]|nr:MAG: arsenate reductase [Bacteroidia bacterium]